MVDSSTQIRILPDLVTIGAKQEVTVLDNLLEAGISLDHSCGGFGTCGTCRVYVNLPIAALGERTELEQERAQERGFGPQERLACQIYPCPQLVITRPGYSTKK